MRTRRCRRRGVDAGHVGVDPGSHVGVQHGELGVGEAAEAERP